MAVSVVRSKYLLLTNPSITYCPIAKIKTMTVNTAISETDALMPPEEVAIPTIELSMITATTIAIMTMKIILFPTRINDLRHQCKEVLNLVPL